MAKITATPPTIQNRNLLGIKKEDATLFVYERLVKIKKMFETTKATNVIVLVSAPLFPKFNAKAKTATTPISEKFLAKSL